MTTQNHVDILQYVTAKNKCGKDVKVGYFKPTLTFIDYLSRNSDQHLPVEHDNKTFHVVIDKLNSLSLLNNLQSELGELIKNQIPKNSPEFLGKEQYYAMFFDEKFNSHVHSIKKIYFPPRI